ncbi:hypothetical protein KW785_03130 [Candidatus Parcubacteria bacterium]|nr:hypothetical protein [Candidatus Parcubacteria bacterium]
MSTESGIGPAGPRPSHFSSRAILGLTIGTILIALGSGAIGFKIKRDRDQPTIRSLLTTTSRQRTSLDSLKKVHVDTIIAAARRDTAWKTQVDRLTQLLAGEKQQVAQLTSTSKARQRANMASARRRHATVPTKRKAKSSKRIRLKKP